MSIRDENLKLKKEALDILEVIHSGLEPILDSVLDAGMTYEDFYCLVGDEAQLLILQHVRHSRN